MASLKRTQSKDNILLDDRNRKVWTKKEVHVFFERLNDLQYQLYCSVFRYAPLAIPILNDLKDRLSVDKNKYTVTIDRIDNLLQQLPGLAKNSCIGSISYLNDAAELAREIRLFYYTTEWLDCIARIWTQPTNIDHEEIDILFHNHKSRRHYLRWCSQFQEKYNIIVKMKQQMARDNQGLVRAVVMDRLRRHPGECYADLFQEGMVGMIHGLARYDYQRGLALSTYVNWWVRHALQREADDANRMIRLPVHLREKVATAARIQNQYYNDKGIALSNSEVASQLKMDPSLIDQAIITSTIHSMDKPLNATLDKNLHDVVANDADDGHDIYLNKEVQARLSKALNNLTAREKDIILLRFGFDNNESLTLKEVGNNYRLTRERIRQLEEGALHKLRKQLSCSSLSDFIE